MEILEDVVPPEPPDVMFGILPVKVVGNEIEMNTYAFIYNGSDSTLVDKQLVESLGISGTKVNDFTLTTMHGSGSRGSSEPVLFEVKPLKGSRTIKIDRAWTEESLPISCGSIPSREDLRQWPHLWNIDIPQLEQAMLISCDGSEAHCELEQRRGRRTEPYAVRTRLGWTLRGPASAPTGSYKIQHHINYINRRDDDVHVMLERMYNHEFP